MEPVIYQCNTGRPEGAPPVTKEELYCGTNHDFNLVRVAAGAGRPPHPHNAGDSFMLVLTGTLHLSVDGKVYDLPPGALAIIPKGAVRGFTAGDQDVTFFAAHLQG
ncbi:MAG TPA: cupin domain-containing protein [Symbiobacteriaceae bacterium]|jgi:quercetin dioxygenase-like cupin family protein